MPRCFREKEEAEDSVPADTPLEQNWREPPGYLGEAVRRAKRIALLLQNRGPRPSGNSTAD